ncbi:MAG: hypothetical protein KBE04_06625, partial [Phycisphaerae bacterium]|nr:hypothetical protein [Phycisphaerae bacterium]
MTDTHDLAGERKGLSVETGERLPLFMRIERTCQINRQVLRFLGLHAGPSPPCTSCPPAHPWILTQGSVGRILAPFRACGRLGDR